MKRRRFFPLAGRRPTLALTSAAILVAIAAGAATNSPTNRASVRVEPQATPQIAQLTLFVTAHDENGRPVGDLKAAEVRLSEDGVEQKIESFGPDASTAVLLGVLIDISGSRRGEKSLPAQFTALRTYIHTALQGVDGGMYLVAFNDEVYVLTQLTNDLKELDRALDEVERGPLRGSTALYDAVHGAAGAKLSGRSGRRAVLVLSDFQDNASRNILESAIRQAEKTQTSVYCLVDQMMSGAKEAKKTAAGARQLSEETGGQAFIVDSPKSMMDALDHVASDLRSFYALRYNSSQTASGKNPHKLQITTSRKGVTLSASRCYFSPKR